MNTKAPLFTDFHLRVVEAATLVKQTAVYTPVGKSIAREKTRKSTSTSTAANIFNTSNPLWNFHLTQLTPLVSVAIMLFKESLPIRRRKPDLNHGAKASKEILIFH